MNTMNNLQHLFNLNFLKNGKKILIKKSHLGRFTEYCDGKVTLECINKGKNSADLKIRKQATFADNARKWKHVKKGQEGIDTSLLTKVKINGTKAKTSEELAKEYLNSLNSLNERTNDFNTLYLTLLQNKLEAGQLLGNKIGDFAGGLAANALQKHLEKLQEKAKENYDKFTESLTPEQKQEFISGGKSLQGTDAFALFLESLNKEGNKFGKLTTRYMDNLAKLALADYLLLLQQAEYLRKLKELATDPAKLLADPNIPTDLEKGGKLKTTRTLSILDDTGVINRKTLKLK